MEILRVKNLSFKYPLSDRKSLDDVSLSISQGEFVVLCGHSGCGKTTLLRMLKKQLAPFGEKQGNVYYDGKDVQDIEDEKSAREIGFVMQDPESQIVTDKVWHELSFGLENIGMSSNAIRRRIGEMSSYFGIESIFDKNVNELSGGQKQMLNLAAVMAMDPKVLILDEPTSQLDPIAASEFISTLKKINRERSVTVIIAEHSLEDLLSEADKLIVMKDSRIIGCGIPEDVCRSIDDEEVIAGLPVYVRFYKKFPFINECPLNVKDCKRLIEENFNRYDSVNDSHSRSKNNVRIAIKNVTFRYEKNSADVLKELNLNVFDNEVLCIMGGNASGKTTLLKIIASILKPYRGNVKIFEGESFKKNEKTPQRRKIAYLAQNPNDLFVKETVMDDFNLLCDEKNDSLINDLSERFRIGHALKKHPYDLSYGELQRCAIVKILLTDPDVILLDEPTKGIDAFSKSSVTQMILDLKKRGKTLVVATHDAEFAAQCADRCAFLFAGETVSCETPETFFSENVFYTTASSRLSQGTFKETVTFERLSELCERNRKV